MNPKLATLLKELEAFGQANDARKTDRARRIQLRLGGENRMSAYVIVDIDVRDPVQYEEHKKLAPTVAAYGGKYIVRGGKVETLEGDWLPKRLVIFEFQTVDQAKAWLNSPEYSPVRKIRHATATTRMIVVAGVAA